MAAGDPIKLGSLSSNGTFLLTAETGGIIENYDRSVTSSELKQYDGSVGYTTGRIKHDFVATYTFELVITGSTGFGVSTAGIGVVLTCANPSTGFGVGAGGIYPDTIRLALQAGQMRKTTFNCSQYHSIS